MSYTMINPKTGRLPKKLYAAAKWAGILHRNGTPPDHANQIAGQYYGYTASEVGIARNDLKDLNKKFKSRGGYER